MSKNIILMEIETNPNIGLFLYSNDKFAIAGNNFTEKQIKEIEKNLDVPAYQTTILGTDLIGVFTAGNNEKLIIPEIYDYEKSVFEEISQKHEIEVIEVNDKVNTFGNSLLLTNDNVIIGKEVNKALKEKIEKKTKMKTMLMENSEYSGAGTVLIHANDKLFASQALNENDVKEFAEQIVGVGSINSGSNFISSGVVANKNGIIMGSSSSTVEIQNLVESLDYL